MGITQGKGPKEAYSQTFTVPETSGFYAPERIAFGEVASGMPNDAFQGVTALVETTVASMVVELWVRKVGATYPWIDDDYVYSGQALDAATGAETFALAAVPGAQIRVKSGGTAGAAVVGATAF